MFRPMAALTALLLAGSWFTAGPGRAGDRLSFDGYVKSFVIGFDQPGVTAGPVTIDPDFLWANNNRVRGNVRGTLAEWLTFRGSYDFSLRIQDDDLFAADPMTGVFSSFPVYRAADFDARVWPDNPGRGDNVAIFHNLDRFYFTAAASKFDVIAGRQVIAWGSAHAINPTDVLTPFLFTEIDTEDRAGVDAVRLRVPAGMLGEVDAGFVAGKDFIWNRSAAYIRGKFYMLSTDVAVLAMAFRENLLCGIDIARSAGGAGVWCEAAHVWANAAGDGVPGDDNGDYLRLSAGADYNFQVGNGLYAFCEYHYNGAGANEPGDYISNLGRNSTAYADGSVYLLGRHYVIPGISYQLSALMVLFVQSFVGLSDGSVFVSPYVEYNIAENMYLSLGAYAAFGDNPSVEASQEPPGSANMILNSEFGSYPDQYYAFLRYYF